MIGRYLSIARQDSREGMSQASAIPLTQLAIIIDPDISIGGARDKQAVYAPRTHRVPWCTPESDLSNNKRAVSKCRPSVQPHKLCERNGNGMQYPG